MNQSLLKRNRILALAPSVRGVGFAVLDRNETLVDWGVKSVKGKNTISLAKVKELIKNYEPGLLVLENATATSSRRSKRMRLLHERIITLGKDNRLPVHLFSFKEIKQTLLADSKATKDDLAGMLANRFLMELGWRLPPKRRAWMNLDYRMCIFEAVALAVVAKS